jgi:hypothetical protein
VNIANDVERTGFRFLIVVEGDALENDGLGFFRGRKNQNMTEAFAFEAAEGATQVLKLVVGDVIAKTAVGTNMVAVMADSFRHVEDDSDREAMILAGEFDERLAIFRLDVGGIGNG